MPAITTAGIYPGTSNVMAAHLVSLARKVPYHATSVSRGSAISMALLLFCRRPLALVHVCPHSAMKASAKAVTPWSARPTALYGAHAPRRDIKLRSVYMQRF